MKNSISNTQSVGTAGVRPRPAAFGVLAAGIGSYALAVWGLGRAAGSHKRSPMADTTINGWPPGLLAGSS